VRREHAAVRAVVQRVSSAAVAVAGEEVARIGPGKPGLCVLVGITHSDTPDVAAKMAEKLWHLRVFDDDAGVMNRSAADIGAELLVVSQFTVYGDTSRGRRPSWIAAARPEVAEPLVEAVVDELRRLGAIVATGRFQTEMQVTLTNDGPVTLIIDR
jgi:D-aminoacyl-tRNA deacylase